MGAMTETAGGGGAVASRERTLSPAGNDSSDNEADPTRQRQNNFDHARSDAHPFRPLRRGPGCRLDFFMLELSLPTFAVGNSIAEPAPHVLGERIRGYHVERKRQEYQEQRHDRVSAVKDVSHRTEDRSWLRSTRSTSADL
jgi:hypothetical protein